MVVTMIKNDVGFYAGDVYALLSKKGRLSVRKIGEVTQQRDFLIFLSIGWLLRENKVLMTEQDGELLLEINATLNDIYY